MVLVLLSKQAPNCREISQAGRSIKAIRCLSPISERGVLAATKQAFVSRDKSQVIGNCSGRDESVGRVPMGKAQRHAPDRNLVIETGLSQWSLTQSLAHPGLGFAIQSHPTLPRQCEDFPNTDRRQPDLVSHISQFARDSLRKKMRIAQAPEPNVSIEQESHDRSASHSPSSLAGETTSPTILALPAMQPSQD